MTGKTIILSVMALYIASTDKLQAAAAAIVYFNENK